MNRPPTVLLAVVVAVEAGGLALSPESGGHERTGDGNRDPGGEGDKHGHAPA